jgi:hypothetical protein
MVGDKVRKAVEQAFHRWHRIKKEDHPNQQIA